MGLCNSGFPLALEPVHQHQRLRGESGLVCTGPAPGQLADFPERVGPCPAFAVQEAQLLKYPGKLPLGADPAHRMAICLFSRPDCQGRNVFVVAVGDTGQPVDERTTTRFGNSPVENCRYSGTFCTAGLRPGATGR